MKTLHLGIISILVVVITIVIVIQFTIPHGSTITSSILHQPDMTGLCENEFKPREFQITKFPNGTSVTINYTPVFLMKPNSTGKICTNNWRIEPEMNYSGKVITGIGKGDSSAPQDVTVVADPDTITMDSANKTIVYTITTSKDAVGFYRFSPMFSDCGGIPIAVGYDSTHLFDNDFPWLWETVPCPHSLAYTEVTGLIGIDVAYITKEYR
jgi:hypothetical protein